MTYYDVLRTPAGWCGAVTSRGRVCRVVLGQPDRASLRRSVLRQFPGCRPDAGACREAVLFLAAYFFEGASALAPARIDPGPATPFQLAVWNAAALIPFGRVRTYGWIAGRIGRPGAARAVGSALGANPLPLIIACHRVVCANGGPGGFSAFGGVMLKRRLLKHEGIEFDERGRVAGMESGERWEEGMYDVHG